MGLSRNINNKIYGLEIDPSIVQATAEQYASRNNVTIIPRDAVQNLPKEATLFYFYNPFSEFKVRKFEERLRNFPQNNIRNIYYNPKSIDVFNNEHWNIRYINFEKDLGIKRWAD